jgi:Pyridoxamine 5'-phosphate oxidase
MDDTLKSKILKLLDHHRLMTVATNRPDGWPRATTVGYVKRRPEDLLPVQSEYAAFLMPKPEESSFFG